MVRAFLIRVFVPCQRRTVASAVLLALGMSGLAVSQLPSGSASAAQVTFTMDFPQSDPSHYSIAVDTAGHASYECVGKVQEDSEEQSYRTEFNVSAVNRERIFGRAKQAKYFSGKIDSGNQKLAFTGTKILSYQDGTKSFTARYNYSSLEPVRQLTEAFQNMAGTLDYGRRLAYYHRYQKLALDEELKRMEMQARNNQLSEIQGLEPVLQAIVEDTSVMNGVRARAKALIELGSGAANGH